MSMHVWVYVCFCQFVSVYLYDRLYLFSERGGMCVSVCVSVCLCVCVFECALVCVCVCVNLCVLCVSCTGMFMCVCVFCGCL